MRFRRLESRGIATNLTTLRIRITVNYWTLWTEAEVQLDDKWSSIWCGCQCRGKSERGADFLHPTNRMYRREGAR
jgi:hypothetical protein